jgi:glutathione S-transferase
VIYHAALPTDWDRAIAAGSYQVSTRGSTLAEVGFIHASYDHQLEAVANTFYADVDELVVLVIDPDAVGAPVVDEPVAGDRYPHVYGPLPIAAVLGSVCWTRPQGQPWRWRRDLADLPTATQTEESRLDR